MFGFKSVKEQVASRFEIGGITGAAYILTGRNDCLLAMKICYHATKQSKPGFMFFGNVAKYFEPYLSSATEDQKSRASEVSDYILGSGSDGFRLIHSNEDLQLQSPSLAKAIKKCDVDMAVAETGIK